MNLYNALREIIDFFVRPFLTALDEIGISDMLIKVGFDNIEWISISLYDLIALVGNFIILYLFFKIVFKILKLFIRMITGGLIK